MWKHRHLLAVMTARELKARYRGSVLGFLWSLANPLLLLGVYTFVFSLVFQPRVEGQSPYPVFLVCGIFPWVWVSSSLNEGTTSLTGNAGLIRRSVFPVELLPLVPVLSNLVNFLLSIPILVAALLAARALGHPVGGPAILLLPVVILAHLPFVAGTALALAALAVHFKDVRDIVSNLLTLGFFLTPILYSVAAVPYQTLRALILWNPLTPFVLAYQDVLFRGRAPEPAVWAGMALASVVAWSLGAWVFDRLSDTLIEAV
ncbi:MAG TPA: ABC transporter permease [Thermoanaerobaculia bacterium]|nr:ABC transporter permease [Thermoanaerobaculia bacterium]